ncbi:AbrB/MazE/SpoVT family DNA-binding domain-containing protein [Sphingomonas sp. Y38-1Y]|uniref:AbrB/MazE/SpoVT family DNA-binding domain-containing protein n=1 Tax=Sphingomonas sp. Y38-1Y TaxID=3078265 RepID=UPI0028E2A648|nr:AbrB/MazE/SpoVT family DNA-binding domain-containing protein [Sphingomonas sp. Y38-1Y]
MGKIYQAKIFKSGNSVALRLPKAMGLKEGMEMTLRENPRGFDAERVEREGRIDLTGIAGSIPDLKPLTAEDREIESNLDFSALRDG